MIKQAGENTDYVSSMIRAGLLGTILGRVGGGFAGGRENGLVGALAGLGGGLTTGALLEFLMKERNPLTAFDKWERDHELRAYPHNKA